jgi:hypothetical protein
MFHCNSCEKDFAKETSELDDMGVTKYCSECGSQDYYLMANCLECKKPFDAEELYHGLCEECLEAHANLETAIPYSMGAIKTEIEINPLLAVLFSENEIEEILLGLVDDIKRLVPSTHLYEFIKFSTQEFCLDDKDGFSKYLKKTREEVKT